jgi:UDP-N-acetylglucosamine 2-epimerase (non-hydrolysing)
MKLAPVARALRARSGVEHLVVHTGQHYDALMSDAFFADLDLPPPQFELKVGSGTHSQQTAAVMERFEPLCHDLRPDWVLVYGDVNSTVAAALTAAKLGLRVAHVEAGLRSYDRSMPEEHNRVVADHLADLLFTPSRDADENLRREGISDDRIAFVGNVMIDTLVHALPKAKMIPIRSRLGLVERPYAVVTFHRPSNVDNPGTLGAVVDSLVNLASRCPVVFPVHPRTKGRLIETGLLARLDGVQVLDPLSYLEMLSLVDGSALVITDSGGLQEETTFLGVPCITVRPNTERPITVRDGTNRLVPPTHSAIVDAVNGIGPRRGPAQVERWDGRAADRITSALCDGCRFE